MRDRSDHPTDLPERSRQLCGFAACALCLVCILTMGSPAYAQSLMESYTPVSQAMLLEPPDGEWLMWRRTYDHWGYSPLAQINGNFGIPLSSTPPYVLRAEQFGVRPCQVRAAGSAPSRPWRSEWSGGGAPTLVP